MSKAYALFHAFQERRKDRGKGEETNEPDKIEKLEKMGILIHGDNLKTRMILKPVK